MKQNHVLMIILVVALLSFTACAQEEDETLVIADQFGLAYAPVEILKATNFLDQAFEEAGLSHVEIEWKRMGNTAAIREAMVAGDLDIGFIAIPPFLIGRDNGMDWRIISGVSESPVGLVASNAVHQLSEMNQDTRILLPQLGSIQHILLAMYAEKTYGESSYFDENIVAMSHPDGMTSLLSNPSAYMHFTTPPYLEKELTDEQFHSILSGKDAFGGAFTFIVSVCPERVHKNEALYTAYKNALTKAIDYINEYPEESFEMLSNAYDYDAELLRKVLENPDMKFTSEIKGMTKFQTYMYDSQMIQSKETLDALIWE